MQIRARAKCAQLEERDAFESKTGDRILFRVARAFIPQTTVRLQQLGILARETIKTRTAETGFTFHDEAQRHRKLAECFRTRRDRGQPLDEIAFAVCGAARVEFSVLDR